MNTLIEAGRTLLRLYEDPLFFQFPVASFLLSTGCFLVFSMPYTLLDLFRPAFSVRRQIQQRPEGMTREILKYLRAFVPFLFLQSGFVILFWPALRFSGIHAGAMPPASIIAIQLVCFLFLDDFLFYWVHRLLHRPWLYRRIHALHHEARVSVALAAIYFHPLEYLLVTLSSLSGPILLGAHVHVLYIWIVLRQLIAVDGHSGYFFRWNPLNLIPMYDGSIFHDWHHARIEGNYGLFFSYLDRAFHTFSKGYRENRAVRPK